MKISSRFCANACQFAFAFLGSATSFNAFAMEVMVEPLCKPCETVTVECADSEYLLTKNCTITIPTKTCEMLGFEDGTLNPQSILDMNCKGLKNFPDNAYKCCAVKHEAHHTQDKNCTDTTEGFDLACAEKRADEVQVACLNEVTQEACKSGQPGKCKEQCIQAYKLSKTKQWDACICAASKTADSKAACADCKQKCKEKPEPLPPGCGGVISVNNFDTNVMCDAIADKEAHSCDFYFKLETSTGTVNTD